MTTRKISLAELREIKQQGVSVTIAGIVINMVISLMYDYGVWILYFTFKPNFPYSFSILALLFPLMYIITNLTIPFGQKIINHQKSMTIITWLILALSLSYYIIGLQNNIYLLSIILLFVIAPITGLIYTIPFHCSSRYFPSSNNILNSIFQIFQGFGVALFNYYIFICANPENQRVILSNDEFHQNRFYIEYALKTMSVLLLISAIFIKIYLKYPKYLNTKLLLQYQIAAINFNKTNITSQNQMNQSQQQAPQPAPQIQPNHFIPASECKTIETGVSSLNFWLIVLMGLLTMNGFYIISYGKLIGLKINNNDNIITLFVSISFFLFGFTRLIFRGIIQKYGFNKIFYIVTLINALNIYYTFHNKSNIYGYGINQILSIFIYGFYFNWFVMYIPKIFGYKLASRFITIFLSIIGIYNLLIHLAFYFFSEISGYIILECGVIIGFVAFLFVKQDVIWS